MKRLGIFFALCILLALTPQGAYAMGYPSFLDKIKDYNEQPNIGQQTTASSSSGIENLLIIIVIIGGLITLIAIIFLVKRELKKRKAIRENSASLEKCRHEISELDKEHPRIRYLLYVLEQENPKTIWEGLKTNFDKIVIKNIWKKFDEVERFHQKGRSNIDKTKQKLDDLTEVISEYVRYYDDVSKKVAEVELAKTESAKLLGSLPDVISKTKTIVEDKKFMGGMTSEAFNDLHADTCDMFVKASIDFRGVKTKSRRQASHVNWIEIYSDLKVIEEVLSQAQASAEKNKELVLRAMKEGAELLKAFHEFIASFEKNCATNRAKRILAEVKRKYNHAKSLAEDEAKPVDWLDVYLILTEANALIKSAQSGNSDVVLTRDESSPGPDSVIDTIS